MTLQQLEAKRDQIAKERLQTQANLNAQEGALQVLAQLIAEEIAEQRVDSTEVNS